MLLLDIACGECGLEVTDASSGCVVYMVMLSHSGCWQLLRNIHKLENCVQGEEVALTVEDGATGDRQVVYVKLSSRRPQHNVSPRF